MSQREMAAHLNEALGTMKTRLRLGMQKLKDALAAEVEAPLERRSNRR